MPLKRIHVGIPLSLYRDLQALAQRWGLDITSTIKHCIARCIEESDLSPRTQDSKYNKRGPSEKHEK